MYRFPRFIILVFCLLLVFTVSCAQSPTAKPTVIQEPSSPEPAGSSELVTLKIAVLPILDTLPMYVAQQEGLFEQHGVLVEFIPAGSAPVRDQIITAGQADGMINEVVSTILYNKDTLQIQIVRFSRKATSTSPQYHILASQQSGITSPDGLQGVEIGISQGTVIEYITDRLLAAEGIPPDQIKTVAVPDISARMSLLASGELKAATLPDPLAFLAEQQGAVIVLQDSKHPEYGYSTISFRKEVIDSYPEAIRGFLAAIEEATTLINADPGKWSSLLAENKLVPEPLMGSYKYPEYPSAGVPSQAQWDDVLSWMKENGLVTVDVSYQDSVTDAFLP